MKVCFLVSLRIEGDSCFILEWKEVLVDKKEKLNLIIFMLRYIR